MTLNILCAVSFAYLLLTVVLWVRSYYQPDRFLRNVGSADEHLIVSEDGMLVAQNGQWDSRAKSFYVFSAGPRYLIPYCIPAGVFAVLPVAWLVARFSAGRRRKAGLCPGCQYDLRATPDRCPECGWKPAEAAVDLQPAAKRSAQP